MTLITPTFTQIKAQVSAIRQKRPHAQRIALRASGQWTEPQDYEESGITYRVQSCHSPLAMRLALRENLPESVIQIIITELTDKDLEEDILLRLTKQTLFPINGWHVIQSLFQARRIDPRLIPQQWIADCLMNWAPPEGYSPALGGFLDSDTVWTILLNTGIGLRNDRPDLVAILQWSIDPSGVHQFRTASESLRLGATERLVELAGASVRPILRCIEHQEDPLAVPLGLVLGILFHSEIDHQVNRAIGKLEERYLGGCSLTERDAAAWHKAATEVVQVQLLDLTQKQQQFNLAQAILEELGTEAFLYLSDILPKGFNQRLARFGQQCINALEHPTIEVSAALKLCFQSLQRHYAASQEPRRIQKIEMAMRLMNWLAHGQTQPSTRINSFEQAVFQYMETGAYLDWARLTLCSGDPVADLSQAYDFLCKRITEFCEQQAHQFAVFLKDATAIDSFPSSLTPVETIIQTVIVPLAKHTPVLAIVMDGMSLAVCYELLTDILNDGWDPIAPTHQKTAVGAGLAAIPCVTEVSRTSLLSGFLSQGTSRTEQTKFSTHPELLKLSKKRINPVLFHKPALQQDGDAVLAPAVRQAIANPKQQVVGVIVNAVDDHLHKDSQIDIAWSLDTIAPLRPLFYEAQQAKRLVILLSDHGHVLESKTQYAAPKGIGGERWRWDRRCDQSEITTQELSIQGQRVVLPEAHQLIAPWSEQVRYGMKKNGYHGGLNPQEMLIPIAVLCSTDVDLPDWEKKSQTLPDWWELEF